MKNPFRAFKIKLPGISSYNWREKDEHFWLIVRWETGDNEGYHSILSTFAQRKQKERFTVVNSFPEGSKGYNQAKRAINTEYPGV